MAVSVPTRYLHSPVCVMDPSDVENTLELLKVLLPEIGALQ